MKIIWLRVLYVSAVFYISHMLLLWVKYFFGSYKIGAMGMIGLTAIIIYIFNFSKFRGALNSLEKKDSYDENYKISKSTFVATLLLFSHALLTLYGFLKEVV